MEIVLVSGGAGFIGSHLVKALLGRGYRVRVLDALVPQVHGKGVAVPRYLPSQVEFIDGDVADVGAWKRALPDVSAVFHLAAEVGVGQSMYEITRYIRANTLGTANMLQLLVSKAYPVQRLVVASSMSIYGEGLYKCAECGPVCPPLRLPVQLEERDWEMHCPQCNGVAEAVPTPEEKPLAPTSIYAISKRDQEEMCLTIGRAYEIPTVALRFFNVYGPQQALSNPYTGIAAIFSSRLLTGNRPLIFEDGLQSRDFVHVSDIVQACLLALDCQEPKYGAFNIGTGRRLTVLEVAKVLGKAFEVDLQPELSGKFRAGDIRHCFADITKAQQLLGYRPQLMFEDGVHELVKWVAKEKQVVDLVDQATKELLQRGLAR